LLTNRRIREPNVRWWERTENKLISLFSSYSIIRIFLFVIQLVI